MITVFYLAIVIVSLCYYIESPQQGFVDIVLSILMSVSVCSFVFSFAQIVSRVLWG